MAKAELTDLQYATLNILKERLPGTPVTGKDIANAIGLKPRSSGKEGADMRSIIHALRVKGHPICADGRGYWLPASKEELKAYIESFQGRVDDQQAAVDGMRLGLANHGLPEKPVRPLPRYIYRDVDDKLYDVPAEQVEMFEKKFPGAKRE